MKVSFAPLSLDAIEYLSTGIGIDYGMIDFTQPQWLCVTARNDDGELMGVLVCEFKTWFEVHCSYAITDRRCVSRRLLRSVFRTLFSRAVRITSLIAPDNEHAILIARRMGFVYEGYLRKGVEGRRDALIFGMLAEDCRYLPGVKPRPVLSPFPLAGASHGLNS